MERIHFLGHVEARPYEFRVCGTTGAAYIVDLNPETPRYSCTCADFEISKRRCKHIMFVLGKCLGFGILMVLKPDAKIKPELLKGSVCARLAHFELMAAQAQQGKKKEVERKPWVDEICAICLERMEQKEPTIWCQDGCGRSTHQWCFKHWMEHNAAMCVYCGTTIFYTEGI